MGSDSRTVTLSAEEASGVYQMVKDEEWREQNKRDGLATRETAGIYAVQRLLPIQDFHTARCRCLRVRFPDRMKMYSEDLREINEGDRVPRGDAYRRLTAEEIAAGVVTLEAAQRLRDVCRPTSAAAELVRSVEKEISRAKLERDAIERRIADLGDSLAIAEARVTATAADIEKHLEDLSPEERARVIELAATFERRCIPDPPSQEPQIHSLARLRSAERGDAGPEVWVVGKRGLEKLKVDMP